MINPSSKDLNLSWEELKEISKLLARKEELKAMKSCLKIKCSYVIRTSKKIEKNFDDIKSKTNLSKARIEMIRKEFNESRHIFFKSKINEISKNLYELKNKKKSFLR